MKIKDIPKGSRVYLTGPYDWNPEAAIARLTSAWMKLSRRGLIVFCPAVLCQDSADERASRRAAQSPFRRTHPWELRPIPPLHIAPHIYPDHCYLWKVGGVFLQHMDMLLVVPMGPDEWRKDKWTLQEYGEAARQAIAGEVLED